MAYATTAQLKSHLGITDASQDTYLGDLLSRATGFIETYTGRKFAVGTQTLTDELYECQGRIVWLRAVAVEGVTTVKVKTAQSDDYETLDADTYEWTTRGRLDLPFQYDYVQVTYDVNSSGVPADIEEACLMLAADKYKNNGSHGPVKREEIGDLTFEYQADGSSGSSAANAAMKTLDMYRVRHV